MLTCNKYYQQESRYSPHGAFLPLRALNQAFYPKAVLTPSVDSYPLRCDRGSLGTRET